MKRLLFNLTHEQTSEEGQLEIIQTLSETVLLYGEVESALKELTKRGSECENEEDQTGCFILDMVSLKAHTELIRRQVESLTREDQESWDYYKDMALDGVLIIAGVGFLFIPVGGPVISSALFTARVASIGKFTGGSIVTSIGLYRVGREMIGGENEDLKTVFEFVKEAMATNILTKAIFHFAQLGDEKLLEQIVFSSSEEDLLKLFYRVIEDDSRLDETRSVAVETLLAFPEELQIRRTKTTKLLMKIADENSNDLDLGVRVSAVKVLGKIGERVPEVAEYLLEKGGHEGEIEDELRLISLVQSGRNRAYFDISMATLAEWLRGRNYKDRPLNIQYLEVSDTYIDLLLSAKEETKTIEKLEKYIIVLKEFILSGILDIETKLKFSEVLINWTKNSTKIEEIKGFFKEVWKNPAEDIGLYVEQLEHKKPTQANRPAFSFLKAEISKLKRGAVKNPGKFLQRIESIIGDTGPFYDEYSNQKEIAKKLGAFIEIYQKIQEFIQN